jgi:hypothetical protein
MPLRNGIFFDNFLLRATPRIELNDPFEFQLTPDFNKWILKNSKLKKIKISSSIEIANSTFPFIGAISFTETKSNLVMWAHYAEGHSGIVIEFDFKNKFFKDIQRVRYDNLRPSSKQVDNWDELLLLKSDDWINEKEYRLIKNLSEHDYFINSINNSPNPSKKSATHNPYGPQEKYMFKVPEESIISVTFGCNIINKDIKENIIAKIRNNKKLSKIILWQADLSDSYYHLEFKKIK